MAKNMVQYLHFRILEFPLIWDDPIFGSELTATTSKYRLASPKRILAERWDATRKTGIFWKQNLE
jgi:hypothetical protein